MPASSSSSSTWIDMEHAPHSMGKAYELVFAAQACGMAALVRLPDQSGSEVQRLLDGGADGLLVPRIDSIETARRITRQMVFAPNGERGLGATSRAGRWGLMPMAGLYRPGQQRVPAHDPARGTGTRSTRPRIISRCRTWAACSWAWAISSCRAASRPRTRRCRRWSRRSARRPPRPGKLSGIAAGSPKEARSYLDLGYSLVMVSNDTTLFGKAAQAAVAETLE